MPYGQFEQSLKVELTGQPSTVEIDCTPVVVDAKQPSDSAGEEVSKKHPGKLPTDEEIIKTSKRYFGKGIDEPLVIIWRAGYIHGQKEMAKLTRPTVSEEEIEELWYKHHNTITNLMHYDSFKAAINELSQKS